MREYQTYSMETKYVTDSVSILKVKEDLCNMNVKQFLCYANTDAEIYINNDELEWPVEPKVVVKKFTSVIERSLLLSEKLLNAEVLEVKHGKKGKCIRVLVNVEGVEESD